MQIFSPTTLSRSLLSLLIAFGVGCNRTESETVQPGDAKAAPAQVEVRHEIEGWDTLRYPDRHLELAMPTGWTVTEDAGVNEEDGLAYWELQAEDSDTLYYLSVEDMGGVIEPESGGQQELFTNFVAESLRSFGGELLGMQMITLRGYPGVGYDISIPSEDPDTPFRLSGRMFLVGSHRMLIFGYSSDTIADELELFVDSLEFLPSVDGWARQAYEAEGWADLAMANVAWQDEHTTPPRKEEAVVLYTKALESGAFEGPFAGSIEDRKARILFLLGRVDEALVALDRAATLGYETLASAQIRGLIDFDQKAYAKAIEQYDRILSEGSADAHVLFLRINALAALVGLEEARLADGQGKQGEVDVLVNRLVEAIDQAVQFAPDHAGLRVWKGVVGLRNADRTGATVDLRRALSAEPDTFEARLEWAWQLLGTDAPKAALEYADYVDREAKRDGALMRLAGELRVVAREYDAALNHYAALTKGRDARPELICKHASVLQRLHREKEALELYARSSRLSPSDEDCANSHAWLLSTSTHQELRDGKRAVELVERFVYRGGKPRPRDELSGAVVDTLAAAYAEAQRWDEAVATQKLAIKLAREKGYTGKSLANYEQRLALFEKKQAYREEWSEPEDED